MKKTPLFILMFMLYGLNISAQNMNWTLVNTGTTKNIRDVSFINRDTGFIAGDNGLLKFTTDGGASWTDMAIPTTGQGTGNNNNIKVAQFTGIGSNVEGVLFFDKFTGINRMNSFMSGWMEECGGSMFVYHDSVCSINNYHGGATYEAYAAGSSCEHDGGMYGFFGGFCFTFDTLLTQPGFTGWNDVTSNANGTIVMVGANGYYTYGNGTYTIANYDMSENFLSVDWSDTSTVYAVTDNFGWNLKRSTDNGQTFTIDSILQPTFFYPQIAEIDFTDNDWGVMAAVANINYGLIITKRGNTIDFFQTDSNLTSAFVLDSTLAFAGGLNGKLYKYDQASNVGLASVSESIDFSVFPNPQTSENNFLNIYCKENIKKIIVTDISGKQIFISKTNNNETAQINTSGFVSGIYIIKIFTERGSGTRKFIVN